MTKHSTLLYWLDDFDSRSNFVQIPFKLEETFSDDFLNAFFESLEYDPGEDLVRKVILKVNT